jgi:hypothetical protein
VLCSPTLIIHLILPSVFLQVKSQLQCCCFQDVHEINNNYRKFNMLLQKVSFSNTTSSVRNTGPVSYMQKGTTLKGTAMTNNIHLSLETFECAFIVSHFHFVWIFIAYKYWYKLRSQSSYYILFSAPSLHIKQCMCIWFYLHCQNLPLNLTK